MVGRQHTLRYGSRKVRLCLDPRVTLYRGTLKDIQRFLDLSKDLSIGNDFYIGMWVARISETENGLQLMEYDFENERYSEVLSKSIVLWQEQADVCNSQSVKWRAIGVNDVVFTTPNAFERPVKSIVEGTRDKPNGSSSGWFVYSAEDTEADRKFNGVPMVTLLKNFNLDILRFLGLPISWTFNLDSHGESYIFKDVESHA